jgi:NAD(P)-dependent dehydrogenase (short-subunit alcohol dehydrogenase family)
MTDEPEHPVNPRYADERPVWLVTGAAHGVGRILAEMALRLGNRVVATADRLEDLRSLIDAYDSAVIPIELDVNDESADHETVQRVIEVLGRLDVVVNAAGYDKEGSADDARLELERVQTNLFGALWVSQAALVYMCANTGGRIVQVFGLNRGEKRRDRRLYDTSRRALVEFSEHLAREVAPFGVEVSICVAAERYSEWTDDKRRRTYTLATYDPEGVERAPLFSGPPTARTTEGSKSAQGIARPTDESPPPSLAVDLPDVTVRRVDREVRQRCGGREEACT